MTIYAIKAPPKRETKEKIFGSLKNGEGRFGWSYIASANLLQLRERITRGEWDSLSEDEQASYHDFLLRIKCGDYVVYINLPDHGECTLAKVTGRYAWRFEDDDFNHRFPVDCSTVRTFNRNDAMVPPALRARLILPSRWWTIYAEKEFSQLLESLSRGTAPLRRTPESSLAYLSVELQEFLPKLVTSIQRTHPGKDLEVLMENLFRRLPNVKEVIRKEGRADVGADMIVQFEFGVIPELIRTEILVVQVKSYTGQHVGRRAVDDIKRAFGEHKEATMGLIVSTAIGAGDDLKVGIDELVEESGKPVALLIGTDLAAFFWRFGADLLEL